MKIKMTLELPYDNELQFHDVCMGAVEKLTELAMKACHDGDHEQFRDTRHEVVSANDDSDTVGEIKVTR